MTMKGWTEDDADNLRDRGYELAEDPRTRDLADRKRVIMGGGYHWPDDTTAPQGHIRQAEHPRRIDWWRVLALLIVAGAAAMTFLGLWLILVYVLTAF